MIHPEFKDRRLDKETFDSLICAQKTIGKFLYDIPSGGIYDAEEDKHYVDYFQNISIDELQENLDILQEFINYMKGMNTNGN